MSLIRAVELHRCLLTDSQARVRHATTNGDGAYVGPYSIKLIAEWCRQVGSQPEMNPLGETSCEFHICQKVGEVADSKFILSSTFDEFLMWLKTTFGFASGKFILRGCAHHCGEREFSIAAPRSDGFKVTLYSRKCHAQFVRFYTVYRLAITVKLEVELHNLREQAHARYSKKLDDFRAGRREKEPKLPGPRVGLNVAICRQLRARGRELLNVKLLIFGVGRGDLREVFLARYATLTQGDSDTAMVKIGLQHELLGAMRGAVHTIVNLSHRTLAGFSMALLASARLVKYSSTP